MIHIMNGKMIKYLCLLLFLACVMSCSDPDIHYTVTITKIEKNKEAYYCVYHITSVSEPKLPEDFFLDICDKYSVGDVVTLSR